MGAARSSCFAPFSGLYFTPSGNVQPCAVNHQHILGRVGEQTLHEIWEGARTAQLRSALAQQDLSLGCRACSELIAAGNRSWSTAFHYDHFGPDIPTYPKQMRFVLSNRCNLQCEMCNGDLSSAIRAQREHRPPLPSAYPDSFFDELREFLPHLEQAVFLGGEPFLATEARRVLDLLLEMGLTPQLSVVTNGTQWNDHIERYLRELPMQLWVSIDGSTAETVEALRTGVEYPELMANVDRYHDVLRESGGSLGFHYCLMVQNWHEFGDFLEAADDRDVEVLPITVTGPTRFSLWSLPLEQLEPIVTAMQRQDPVLRLTLRRNLYVWLDELDRLERHMAHLESIAAGQPVAVNGRVPDLTGPADELRAWSGTDPLRISLRDDRIATVDAPPWAKERLGAEGWTDEWAADIERLVRQALGGGNPAEYSERPDGLTTLLMSFGPDGQGPELRAIIGPTRLNHGSEDVDVLMAVKDAGPPEEPR